MQIPPEQIGNPVRISPSCGKKLSEFLRRKSEGKKSRKSIRKITRYAQRGRVAKVLIECAFQEPVNRGVRGKRFRESATELDVAALSIAASELQSNRMLPDCFASTR